VVGKTVVSVQKMGRGGDPREIVKNVNSQVGDGWTLRVSWNLRLEEGEGGIKQLTLNPPAHPLSKVEKGFTVGAGSKRRTPQN